MDWGTHLLSFIGDATWLSWCFDEGDALLEVEDLRA